MSGTIAPTVDQERLPNVQPCEILREDFMIGSAIAVADVAEGSGIPSARLQALLAGQISIDAEIDLRLARYFGMSDGFFLGLQHDFELDEARDTHRDALAQIVRRGS